MSENKNKETSISLVMDNGVIPSLSGVTYKFRDGLDPNVWLYKLTSSTLSIGDIYAYVFSSYPAENVLKNVEKRYENEEWFNLDDWSEFVHSGYDISIPKIFYENGYKLPYQEVTLSDNRIYARDEEYDVYRQLVKAKVKWTNFNGTQEDVSFLMFTKNSIKELNRVQVLGYLTSIDSKVPSNIYEKISRAANCIRAGNDYGFKISDVFVVDGRPLLDNKVKNSL